MLALRWWPPGAQRGEHLARKRIVVLGATGSIGTQALDIVRAHPERLQVVGLAARSNLELLAAQIAEFRPLAACLTEGTAADQLQTACGAHTRVLAGEEGLDALARMPEADLVVGAISGAVGLRSLLAALDAGKDVALANKEPLVAAGRLVTAAAARTGACLLPIDSELSAIFQVLKGEDRGAIRRILLTASGGPFANHSPEQLARVTPEEALNHPTWRMGRKVTVDSATLANKGFEVFEARWLFGVSFRQIEVVVHHQSVVHSLVEFVDGSVIGQMGLPDMHAPIQYALFHPERVPNELPRLDLVAAGSLTFARPDLERFPCLRLAYEAAERGGTCPAVLNAANEVAVERFLAGEISFTDIPRISEQALAAHRPLPDDSLDDILAADAWARQHARQALRSA